MLVRSGLMLHNIIKILYIIEKEERGSKRVQDEDEGLGDLGKNMKGLGEVKEERGELKELGAMLQSLEGVADRTRVLGTQIGP